MKSSECLAKRFSILLAGLLAGIVIDAQAAYPEKPIRFIVPSAPGGSVDVLMRILTQQMSAQMGVQFVIDYAKKNPGKLNNGSSGNGTTGHLGGELFKSMTGVEIVHAPYKGSPQAINDLMAGNIQVMFDNVPSIGPHVKAGRVRGLGVSSPKRAVQFPDLPTIAEAGVPGYETNSWGGVIGPARLSREVILRLHAEIRKALAAPAVAERYRQLDAEPDGGGPAAFGELVRRETPKWAEVIRRSGAKVD